MTKNPLDFPSSSRLADMRLNVERLLAILPDGWVFAGVMRRAGAEFDPDTSTRYVAIATLESPTNLGPVPEMRGAGKDMVGAIVDLRCNIAEEFDIDDPTGRFGEDPLTPAAASVESGHDS